MQTISGIMVDGVDVGASECFHHASKSSKDDPKEIRNFTEHTQHFRGADLIVVDLFGYHSVNALKKDKEIRTYKKYPLYAVYGDKVITSHASEMAITSHYSLFKDKMILATKKPYILSGDLHRKSI
jgi:hypothetical protein